MEITFQDAIQKAKHKDQKLSLLLGNGFSIDFDPQIFSQEKLIQSTQDLFSLENKEIYTGNKNFEEAVQELSELKGLPPKRKQESLKNFIKVLSQSHPNDPHCVKPIQSLQCATFLSNFQSIYTLNYDLLHYWVIMKEKLYVDKFKDGFRKSYLKKENYLTWYSDKDDKTNLRYLHGGLHLYIEPNNNRIAKHRYLNGKSLKEQFVEAIVKNEFPKVVSGGTSQEKLEVINQCDYLMHCLKSLKNAKGILFIHGFNFNPNDQHIMDAIAHSQIEKLFISIHPSNNSKNIRNAIEKIQKARNLPDKKPLEVTYYKATTAQIWRSSNPIIEQAQSIAEEMVIT